MIKLLFLGSGEFPIPIFFELTKSKQIKVSGLITAPDKGNPNNNPLKEEAEKKNIPVFQPQSLSTAQKGILTQTQPEIIIVCNFGQILDKDILRYPKYSCLNIHASLLPALRGACPIEMAILQDLDKTGFTIQRMAEKLDTGDILFQKEISIEENETGGSLRKKLQKLAVENTERVIISWVEGKIKPKKQDNTKATYCFRDNISKKAAKINWNNTAHNIERKIRALNPKPIAWTTIKKKNKRLKIFSASVSNEELNLKFGHTEISNGKLKIQTGDGVIEPKIIQLEGKKKMPVKEFLRGFKEEIVLD